VKKIAIIPTLLTLANAVCGFAAIACASKIDFNNPNLDYYFSYSGWLILGAMVFDALDGYVARLARSSSRFGAELDSLCDAVSFGAAPGFLLLRLGPGWDTPFQHQALAGIATLYMVCTILRLARFNVESMADAGSSKKFRGLPSPGAAGCLATLAILRGLKGPSEYVEVGAALGGLLVALLMVSRVPYPHVTKQVTSGRHPFSHVVQLVVALFIVVIYPQVALAVIFWGYGLGIPVRYAVLRSLRHAAPRPSGLDDAPR
jgi:CDP-diacylglycerol--serine O-phosphatidyltransferase